MFPIAEGKLPENRAFGKPFLSNIGQFLIPARRQVKIVSDLGGLPPELNLMFGGTWTSELAQACEE